MTPTTQNDSTVTLRGGALIRLPFVLFGMLFGSLAMWIVLWGSWNTDHLGAAFWGQLLVCVAISLVFFGGASGCRVQIKNGQVIDYVAWLPRRRVPQSTIDEARVRLGAWRFFELTTDDETFVLRGAGPEQFPSRLRPGSVQADFDNLDLLMGMPVQR